MWKKILGIGLAMAVSLSTSTVPVLAENISIVDDVIGEETTNDESEDDKITDEETTEEWAEDIQYSPLRGPNLNFGDMKIQKISSTEIAINGLTQCDRK